MPSKNGGDRFPSKARNAAAAGNTVAARMRGDRSDLRRARGHSDAAMLLPHPRARQAFFRDVGKKMCLAEGPAWSVEMAMTVATGRNRLASGPLERDGPDPGISMKRPGAGDAA